MKILIIEDDTALAKTVQIVFKKLNIQSDHVESGDEAIEYLSTYTYDLIMLDVLLPDTHGVELLKLIRKKGVNTPVLIVSGLDDNKYKVDGLNQGADDYITKPFNQEELIARVNAIIRRSKGFPTSVINIGPLQINLDSKLAYLNNKNVGLTNKEYAILEILALKQGKPVPKDYLLNQLYGGIDEPEPKIIDVFVCKLRNKLKKITNKNYIGTIWGQGYVLADPDA